MKLDDALTTLLRPAFRAAPGCHLLIADYASIEGRGVAWVAGEQKLLDVFARGEDLYCVMASVIYGRPITKKDEKERQVGKVTVLGCGYSMSAGKFTSYCKSNRLDLAAAGTTADACVEAYRSAYPAIAGVPKGKFRTGGIWKNYNQACMDATNGKSVDCGKCHFRHVNGNLEIVLPSGRPLIYRKARVEKRIPGYAKLLGLTLEPRDTVVYDHPRGYADGAVLYGGLITENIVQAICRDLLAAALIACESEGLQVVLHVHDEIVVEDEDPQQIHKLCRVMATPPTWASGFPIAVEGFSCQRYVKAAWSNSIHGKAKSS